MSTLNIGDAARADFEAGEIVVDGLESPDRLIKYIGRATRQPNGKWHCYAIMCGVMAIVEVSITQLQEWGFN